MSNYKIHIKTGKCLLCDKTLVIERKYSDELLCPDCFTKDIENKILQTIEQYNLFNPSDKVVVGLSGGKDSVALLYNLIKLQTNPKYSNDIKALIIDEGIPNYRNKSIESAIEFCNEYKIPYKIIAFKEKIGKTLEEIVIHKRKSNNYKYACNYCSIFRRRLLDEGTKELGGTVLAVGHNLTDIAETFLMNILFKRFSLIAQKNIFIQSSEENINIHSIKKIKPLMIIPEEEIYLYVNVKKLKYYPSHCPYSRQDPIIRRKVLNFLLECKNIVPNLEFNLLKKYDVLSKTLKEVSIFREKLRCKKCGYPSRDSICQYCIYKKDINN
ncbi:MAG: TIGR00269 family protein [Candidatus Lokiarchaeota archaeon]|nr:TIGR00269 family protein [Candidatus Lokiarchaeota archaeon]